MDLADDLKRALIEARASVRPFPRWMRPLLARDVLGITLGRRIYLAPDLSKHPPREVERLIRHELVHVRQVARLGLPRFLWRYLAEYIRHRRGGLGSAEAYRRISFEIEAHAAEDV